jgi:hypothetical protein
MAMPRTASRRHQFRNDRYVLRARALQLNILGYLFGDRYLRVAYSSRLCVIILNLSKRPRSLRADRSDVGLDPGLEISKYRRRPACYRKFLYRIFRKLATLLYSCNMAIDIWIGAVTTLAGTALGGTISFAVNRQQARYTRLQREEEHLREQRGQSVDRRFQAYSEFLIRARSFRNATEAYYVHPHHKPSLAEMDSLLHSANDASAFVFLVVESDRAYEACRKVLRALWRARTLIHDLDPSADQDPWGELDVLLGRTTREFQNAARSELGVSGPAEPWDSLGKPDR